MVGAAGFEPVPRFLSRTTKALISPQTRANTDTAGGTRLTAHDEKRQSATFRNTVSQKKQEPGKVSDLELERVVNAWPMLPKTVCSAILRLAAMTTKKR